MKQLETSLTNNRSNLPLRELHVKVWHEEATIDLTLPESGVDSVGNEIDVVDDLPTSPLMVTSSPKISTPSHTFSDFPGVDIDEEEVAEELPTNPHITSLPQNTPLSYVSSSPASDFGKGGMSHDQKEDIATRPYAAQPHTNSREIEKPVHQQRRATQAPTGSTYQANSSCINARASFS
jgi:hypothetical protein